MRFYEYWHGIVGPLPRSTSGYTLLFPTHTANSIVNIMEVKYFSCMKFSDGLLQITVYNFEVKIFFISFMYYYSTFISAPALKSLRRIIDNFKVSDIF